MDDTSKHSSERFYGDNWQPGNASVVATIRESLGEHCAGFDKEKHPVVYQSGRTDRNVSGAGQIVQIFRDAKGSLGAEVRGRNRGGEEVRVDSKSD